MNCGQKLVHNIYLCFQVQISESAMFLINLNVVYRLIDLMLSRDPIVREKICMILSVLCNYYQGRQRMLSRPIVIENLMYLIMRDRKEIRFAAAYTLRSLSRDWCSCEVIMKTKDIVPNLLKMIKDDHAAIVLVHLKTLTRLSDWDPEPALRANAFQVMMTLFRNFDVKVASKAMDCMTQLCKHDVGKRLADMYDMTHFLFKHYLTSPHIRVVIAATRLMAFTTQTTRSKWRAKEFTVGITKRLMKLCMSQNMPQLQIRIMQVLINLCDCPDIRYHMKRVWEKRIHALKIRTHEQWDGTTESSSYGYETGHFYRTMCIEGVETIKNEYGDNAEVVNVHSYLRTLQETKERLIYAINFKPHKN